jgi:hypothetical protein
VDTVTRLGKFSPFRLWLIRPIFKNYRSSLNFLGQLFLVVKVLYWFLQKIGRATFWAILLETHLVTLLADKILLSKAHTWECICQPASLNGSGFRDFLLYVNMYLS